GLHELLSRIERLLDAGLARVSCALPSDRGDVVAWLRRSGRVVEEYYRDGVVTVTALVPPGVAGQVRKQFPAPPRGGKKGPVAGVSTVPNVLTLLRLVAIPVFLILLVDFRYREALGVFVAAGVTDALDGAIARLTHTKTTLGAYLDPAADKLLLMSAFVALAFMRQVP